MKEIRAACSELGHKLAEIAKTHKVDTGRMIAALDTLQQVKDIACVALILPHYKKPE